ncbi:two-component sensor histidine kinase [Micromonospora sp. CPCC 205371]|nr:two-component sensor histidine kinase [Micromonospora sp. CPCC 205371]
MTVRGLVAPLVRGSTYRRGVHLLLGGVILLPYALLVIAFAGMLSDPGTPVAATLSLAAAAVLIAVVPAFLSGTRTLEIAAARALLGVDLPDPPPGAATRETRVRGALWYAVHLLAGGAVGAALLVALPMALVFLVQRLGVAPEATAGLRIGPLDEHDTWALTGLGLAMLIGLVYSIAGLGALAALMAPVLLGPSAQERIAALEARADRLAERNRLARELHDSVGHALTVTTLQAAAARELLDTDPEFARKALAAIEETGRSAMVELDHMLGVLREGEAAAPGAAAPSRGARATGTAGGGDPLAGGGRRRRAPQPTLADLDRLVGDARPAGLDVAVETAGRLGDVPAPISREGYRIVQEGLTNAARHAGRVPVTLRVAVTADRLDIELTNALDAAAGEPGGGRGLAGMRERVTLLRGELTAGRYEDTWRVSARLPLESAVHP